MYISIFSLQFPSLGAGIDDIFSEWEKRKEKEKKGKEFLNLETTVVAAMHLVK